MCLCFDQKIIYQFLEVGGSDLSPGLWVADLWFVGSFLEMMVKGISKICERGGEVG